MPLLSKPRRTVLLCCLALALAAATFFSPLGHVLGAFVAWARGAGAVGVLAFLLVHVASTLLLVPAWPLRMAAGFVYGLPSGFAVGLGSSVLAGALPFLLARRLLRARVAAQVAGQPRLAAVDDAVAETGFWVVFLLRLSPLFPNEIVNYALGASRVGFRAYMLATLVGTIPLTLAYAWIGSMATAASELVGGHPATMGLAGQIMSWIGLAATIAVAVATTRAARRALDRSLTRPGPTPAPATAAAPRALVIGG